MVKLTIMNEASKKEVILNLVEIEEWLLAW